jgi:hypothetical protein
MSPQPPPDMRPLRVILTAEYEHGWYSGFAAGVSLAATGCVLVTLLAWWL